MKLRILTKKLEGHKLAVPIYMTSGMILLNTGSTLTESTINKLLQLGCTTVYIQDNSCAIEVQEMVDTKIRLEIIKEIKTLFEDIKKNKKLDKDLVERIVDKAIENLNLSENAFLYNNISYDRSAELELILHSLEVMVYSLVVGVNMRFDLKKLSNLGMGALLHDIGKLFKEDESHVHEGYSFLKSHTRIPTTSYICVLQHHEYEDGSGYPEKLKGDKIYELSKIVGICNDYVILLHSKEIYLPNEIIEIMTAKAIIKYDHEIFRSFKKAVYCYPNGSEVRLSNYKLGIIIKQNKDLPTRPIVAVFEGDKPIAIDLTRQEYQTVFIEEVIM